ncbi:GntR family transcriptional regulator [Maritalea porphyrae]|jgi:DNA-binding GntR family transcriptional regulator|uniref:GntR family transcriptional regulator n=1 Tax=Maritalea porphyrae TaxID=880732 RepID=UPI0022AE5EB2|nr:GntR family transcriptional regulator [Maritalea porphyrae]MCZ4273183.1 GntR family transcriptional regulator [Maritalea porphyrae]
MDLPQQDLEDVNLPTHERLYRDLRERLLFGKFRPGMSVTLQGIADDHEVSLTPVREAIRRLVAEGALEMHGNRRISVPEMDDDRIEELLAVRLMLEPEIAVRAIDNVDVMLLRAIDDQMDKAILEGSVDNYLKCNFAFHFALYRASNASIMISMAESLWLQMAPYMRVVCGRVGTSNLDDQHKRAIAAIEAKDIGALRASIMEDISSGAAFVRTTPQPEVETNSIDKS